MLCKLNEYGLDTEDVYDLIREAVRCAPQFRLDWFIRSRTAAELHQRANTLLTLVEKEMGAEAEQVVEDLPSTSQTSSQSRKRAATTTPSRSSKRTKK